MSNEAFLLNIIPLCLYDEAKTKVPAEVTALQACWESAWGNSLLAKDAKNLFGIKASKGWAGETLVLQGWEEVKGKIIHIPITWRKYSSIQESIDDHSKFLSTKRYAKAFETTNWKDFLTEIWKAGYATDSKYVSGILALDDKCGVSKKVQASRLASVV